MTSIIIPAHNEEDAIEKCLRPLIDYVDNKKVEVVVVCNGCTDQTAKIVSELSKNFICIETDKASKTSALNVGDQLASSFPRFYLDADVHLSPEVISAVSNVLNSGYLFASPEPRMDIYQSSWLVKAFYDVSLSLPYIKTRGVGAGVYALSENGRQRFSSFPEIIADDGYVRRLFDASECGLALGHYSIVKAPKNLLALIKIKSRSRLGEYELNEKYPEIIHKVQRNYKCVIKNLILDVRSWPKVFVYMLVNSIARFRAARQLRNGINMWERDDSSR